jgi:hypothetical protein
VQYHQLMVSPQSHLRHAFFIIKIRLRMPNIFKILSKNPIDPDLCRNTNTMKYINTHKDKDEMEIKLHFINNK